jgi:hypothetical protein
VTLDPGIVPENSELLSLVGQLKVSDPDAGDTHRFILLDSAGGRFTLDGDKVVVATGPELDFETSPLLSITVRAIDAGGLAVDATLPILVTDLNEPPTDIELDPRQVFEDSGVGFVVGQLSSADPDAGDSFTYALVDSADGRFAIQAGQVVFAGGAGLDYEALTSHVVRIKATDAGGLSFEKDLEIEVTNVNEPPTDLKLSNLVLPENSPAGTVVGLLSASDVDYDAAGLVLLTSPDGSAWLANLGPEAVSFDAYQLESAQGKLSPTGWRSLADWAGSNAAEALSVLGPGDTEMAAGWEEAGLFPEFLGEFNVAATAELASNEVVSLGKPLLAGALADVRLTYRETGANAGIRTAPVLDQRPLTFELVGGDGRFEVVGNQLRVAANAKLDFETGSKLPIRVRVVDEGNLSVEMGLVVSLTNVNETPVVAAPVPTIVVTGGSLALPGFKVSDPDIVRSAGDQAQYRFALSSDRGTLSLGSWVGLEIVEGANGSSALTIVGSLNALNAALATLTYQAPLDYVGPIEITLEANDQGYTGAGIALTGIGTVELTVNAPPAATGLVPNADFDGDGDIDLTDFGLLKANFGASTPRAPGDADHNGKVDLTDFGVLKASFGRLSTQDDDVLLALAIDQATRPLK